MPATFGHISDAQIEAAARVLAHREEFNSNKWPKYAPVTRAMLIAASHASENCEHVHYCALCEASIEPAQED